MVPHCTYLNLTGCRQRRNLLLHRRTSFQQEVIYLPVSEAFYISTLESYLLNTGVSSTNAHKTTSGMRSHWFDLDFQISSKFKQGAFYPASPTRCFSVFVNAHTHRRRAGWPSWAAPSFAPPCVTFGIAMTNEHAASARVRWTNIIFFGLILFWDGQYWTVYDNGQVS